MRRYVWSWMYGKGGSSGTALDRMDMIRSAAEANPGLYMDIYTLTEVDEKGYPVKLKFPYGRERDV